MVNRDILKYIKENKYILTDGRVSPKARYKLKNDPVLMNLLIKAIPHRHIESMSFAEIKYCLIYNIITDINCPMCNKTISFEKPNSHYPTTCSKQCSALYHNKPRFINNNPAKNIQLLKKRGAKKRQNFLSKHPKLNDKEWLIKKHTKLFFSITELSTILNVTQASVKKSLDYFNIQTPTQQLLREASVYRKYGVKNVGELPEVREKARSSEYAIKTNGWKSSGEKEVYTFIQTLLPDIEILENNQRIISPYELDIYIPSHNIAIEYCGLYWHSDTFKTPKYHLDKLNRCNDNGIRLVTIFEDEWINKQNIVKSKIENILGQDKRKRVYARKTHIVNVTKETKKQFFEDNHIQGSGPGSITYGLMYDNELVAAMTFIKRNEDIFELNRYATSKQVVGGFSKILSYFKNNHIWTQIISFADLRWSDGNLYTKTGWMLDKTLPPDYSWCKQGVRHHKFNFRHKFLAKKLKNYDPSLTENENCKNNHYVKLFNCGLNRYIINNL